MPPAITESESPAYFGGSEVDYLLALLPSRPASVLELGSGAGPGALHVLRDLPDASLTCLEPGDTVTHTQQVQDRDEGIRLIQSCGLTVVEFADKWLMITR